MGQLRRVVLTYSFSTQHTTGETGHTVKLAESFARLGLAVTVCVIEVGPVLELFRNAGAEVAVAGPNALMRGRRGLLRLAAVLARCGPKWHSEREAALVSLGSTAVLFDTPHSLLLWHRRFPNHSAPFILHWKATSRAFAPLGAIAARLSDAVASPGPQALSVIAPWVGGKPVCVARQSLSWPAARALELEGPDDAQRSVRQREGGDIVALHCGGTIPRKRAGVAARAVVRLREAGLPVVIVIAGPSESASVERVFASLPPRSREVVRFVGWTDQIYDLIRSSDVYVQTSRYEGLSNALIEAAAAGLPIVATDVGDTRDLVHDGENGYLLSPRTWGLVSRTATALRHLVLDNALGEAFGRKSRETIWQERRPGQQAERLKEFIEGRLRE